MEATGLAMAGDLSAMSGALPWTGSPKKKLSPALTLGTRPREPTRAAAPSLKIEGKIGQTRTDSFLIEGEREKGDLRYDVAVQVGADQSGELFWLSEKSMREDESAWHSTEVKRTQRALVNQGVHNLLLELNVLVLLGSLALLLDRAHSLSEETIGGREHVALVHNGHARSTLG